MTTAKWGHLGRLTINSWLLNGSHEQQGRFEIDYEWRISNWPRWSWQPFSNQEFTVKRPKLLCFPVESGGEAHRPDTTWPDMLIETRVYPHILGSHSLVSKLSDLLDGLRSSFLEATANRKKIYGPKPINTVLNPNTIKDKTFHVRYESIVLGFIAVFIFWWQKCMCLFTTWANA